MTEDASTPGQPPVAPGRRTLPLLFLTVFVDLVGFGIVLPLLPLYADRFGASGLTVGLLVMVYSVAQFFMAPIWGRLSDRHGRRPILLLGLLGSAAAYLVFAWAGSVAALFASRILAGIGGSTIPVAEAYIADVTPPEKRAGNMGLIGAAFGLGFTVGPALGGLTVGVSTALPGYLAAALCLANAAIAALLLPETRSRASRDATRHAIPPRRRPGWAFTTEGLGIALRKPGLRRVLLLYFLFTVAFAVIQPTLSLFGAQRFGLDARGVGYLFAFLGLVSAVVQGGLVRRIVPRIGEARLIRICGVPFALGLLLLAWAPDLGWVVAALAFLAVGYGGTVPSVLGLISRASPPEIQGGMLGVGQSVGSLARIAGPVLAGAALDLSMALPYLLGAGVAALGTLGAIGLVQPRISGPSSPATPPS
ncbi:MFS transporter [Gaopeijia maritima]|uniref:MFS transporter n=1 Tax=Gaopeijia maritima TaxID=3119007 RepID=A0ABU9E5C9_9BACT